MLNLNVKSDLFIFFFFRMYFIEDDIVPYFSAITVDKVNIIYYKNTLKIIFHLLLKKVSYNEVVSIYLF